MRYRESGGIHDVTGMSAFTEKNEDILYLMGLMNSPVANHVFKITNPTMHLQIGNFQFFPVLQSNKNRINSMSLDNIKYSKTDWNAFETSWNFEKHALI